MRRDKIDLEAVKAFALGKRLVSDIKRKRGYPAQLRRIEKSRKYFGEVIKARRNDWKEEYLYWKDKGWL